MAHRGKFYPVYNPGKVFIPQWAPPFYLPTEFKWQVDGWAGPNGAGTPTVGRGFVADYYSLSAGGVHYDMSLTSGLGHPFNVQLQLIFDISTQLLDLHLQVFFAAAPQLMTNTSSINGGPMDSFLWTIGSSGPFSYRHSVGYQIYPANFFSISARKWSDGPPFPPASTPF